ncbi:membrane protein, putative [Lunatimonas lonarensis]|uniref:Membrane protein, putative n=1 Tax=Lunatimonas lonarensis TaxID=1232681 RepID=R7ZV33_9BACT|nr:LptF/LptG family permease [Lunatimonas lonarensis]EON77942.1 membrane protein, putative [Lunatimonas lonarensis]
MKKLDKLILGSFIGPFLLTFVVVDFILLTVNMLKYFDEIFGKDLPFAVYMELIGYFVISISPMALPLAVLLSSLMTFGNLGEHFELTAIKSSGISLLRALLPIGVFVAILTVFAYLSNNYLVPRVNLKTFSLLYDIRMKSPALDIKEGVFYNGIPNYSIKVNQKLDEVRLRDVLIYDHTSGQGNIHVITADSGRMEPFFNDRYMMLTLYNGNSYQEGQTQRGINEKPPTFNRTKFSTNQMVFDLEAFEMNRTPENLWSNNRSIKNIQEIRIDLDSMDREIAQKLYFNYASTEVSYAYFGRERKLIPPPDLVKKKLAADSIRNLKYQEEYELTHGVRLEGSELSEKSEAARILSEEQTDIGDAAAVAAGSDGAEVQPLADPDSVELDSLAAVDTLSSPLPTTMPAPPVVPEKEPLIVLTEAQRARLDSLQNTQRHRISAAAGALTSARNLKNNFTTSKNQVDALEREFRRFEISWFQKYTQAIACFVMFMIGAPLGAIIKKGGLGMPVLVSIIFFILYYMLTITGEKWAKEAVTGTLFGTSFSILALIPFGLFFLRQARKDARIFEADFYYGFFQKVKRMVPKLRKQQKLREEFL